MTILTFPNIRPNDLSFWLDSNSAIFESPLSGAVQTKELPGAKWRAILRFNLLTGNEFREMSAFLVSLRGSSGRFYLNDHSMEIPRGIATGTPLINGASQVGSTLITDGWTPSQTNIMKAGDQLHFDNLNGYRELKMVIADVDSDSGGNAVLNIEPPIMAFPVDDEAITVNSAQTIMTLTTDSIARWNVNSPIIANFDIECFEPLTI